MFSAGFVLVIGSQCVEIPFFKIPFLITVLNTVCFCLARVLLVIGSQCVEIHVFQPVRIEVCMQIYVWVVWKKKKTPQPIQPIHTYMYADICMGCMEVCMQIYVWVAE